MVKIVLTAPESQAREDMPSNELASINPEECLHLSLSELKQCFYKKKRQHSVYQSGRARIWTDQSDRRQQEERKQIS
jgi:hypothetical protein